MNPGNIMVVTIVAGALVVSGCGGGGGGGAALPTADFTLPAEYSATGPGGMGDYLNSATDRGYWRVDLDGKTQTTYYGTANLYDALIYDNVNDKWILNVNGGNHTLDYWVDNNYDNWASCSTCLDFYIYDDDGNPATSQYGTFGAVVWDTPSSLGVIFMHAGLKTPSVDMPSAGSATYAGTFWGVVLTNLVDDEISGSAAITANFTSGSGSLTFGSTGTGSWGSYSLGGSATISGNTYNGTVSGWYDDGVVQNFSASGSTLSGAFYGPDHDTGTAGETAGVVSTYTSGGELVGGFWAGQTGYTP